MAKSTELNIKAITITKKQDALYTQAYSKSCHEAKKLYDQADKLQKEKTVIFDQIRDEDKASQYNTDWESFFK